MYSGLSRRRYFPRAMRDCIVLALGTVPYTTAWLWQKMLLDWKRQDRSRPDILMLLEHLPVYTLGQGADPRHVLFAPGEAELAGHSAGQLDLCHGPSGEHLTAAGLCECGYRVDPSNGTHRLAGVLPAQKFPDCGPAL